MLAPLIVNSKVGIGSPDVLRPRIVSSDALPNKFAIHIEGFPSQGVGGIVEMLLQSRPLKTEGTVGIFEIALLSAQFPVNCRATKSPTCTYAAVLKLISPGTAANLTNVEIKSVGGVKTMVRYSDHTTETELKSGGTTHLNSELQPDA